MRPTRLFRRTKRTCRPSFWLRCLQGGDRRWCCCPGVGSNGNVVFLVDCFSATGEQCLDCDRGNLDPTSRLNQPELPPSASGCQHEGKIVEDRKEKHNFGPARDLFPSDSFRNINSPSTFGAHAPLALKSSKRVFKAISVGWREFVSALRSCSAGRNRALSLAARAEYTPSMLAATASNLRKSPSKAGRKPSRSCSWNRVPLITANEEPSSRLESRYGLQKPLFDKTWKLLDNEKIQNQ